MTITPGQRRALALEQLALHEEMLRRYQGNRLPRYRPYPKQVEFHTAGQSHRERLLMAGNQLGKTMSAAYETAMHLTGRYPNDWPGRTWDRGIRAWGAGETTEVVRDSMQLLLCGKIEHLGTGAIPRNAIKDKSTKRGVADSIDTLIVLHGGGGDIQAQESEFTFKSYDQGRTKFQAATLDWVWLDEEPDLDIYTEALTRTNATGGLVAMTFTPLKGMTNTVKRFVIDKAPGTHVTVMTIYDALHYSPQMREAIIASYPAHEREARVSGVPTLGSGRIFPIAEDAIRVPDMPIPAHWVRIGGLDFGWDHPSAAVELAWDREADVVYVTKQHRMREQTPLLFATTIKPWGAGWMPWAWPHDGLQHSKDSGKPLADQYRGHGLNMLPEKATHAPDAALGQVEGQGGYGVEAGLLDMLDRMQTGRLKVFASLLPWFEEFRIYHRDDGKVVKLDDDLMSATRYALMMLRHACTRPAPMKTYERKHRILA
jgi:phage terminase large subunit-like protein